MRYNSDLADKILLYLEEPPKSAEYGDVLIEGYSQEEISYHIKKLRELGFVEALDASGFGGTEWKATDLTLAGHQYLKEYRSKTQDNPKTIKDMQIQVDSRTVFVIHGRNSTARRALFQFLRSIGLHPLEWSQAVERTGKASPYVGEILDAAFSIAQAVVVLMTPDDEARLIESFRSPKEPIYEIELTGQPRQNVIFEAGMAMGMFPDRTILVELGELRPMSDIGGRHTIRINNSVPARQDLANRLKTAGCSINLIGTDWLEEGNFEVQVIIPKPEVEIHKTEDKTKSLVSKDLTEIDKAILGILSHYEGAVALPHITAGLQLDTVEDIKRQIDKLIKQNYIFAYPESGIVWYRLTKKGINFAGQEGLI